MAQALLKPQFKTTISADLYDVFEILISGDAGKTGAQIEPRPRVAYSAEDAVLALAEMLNTQGISVDDMLSQLDPGQQFMCTLLRMLGCEGKTYEHLRKHHTAYTHDLILAKLRNFMPGATPVQATARPTVQQVTDEGPRMQSMGMPGAAKPEPVHPREKPKKEFKVTTVYQGGGDAADKLQELAKSLTAESIPAGGMVITMGKNGPKVLKTATARTDEDEADANLEAAGEGSEEDLSGPVLGATIRDLGAEDDSESILGGIMPSQAMADARPAGVHQTVVEGPGGQQEVVTTVNLSTRTASEDALAASARKPLSVPKLGALTTDGFDSGLGDDEAAAMLDAEFAGMAEAQAALGGDVVIPVADPDHHSRLARQEARGGHAVQKAQVTKKDRGGVRPGREPKV